MGTREWLLDQIRKLWSLASEVLNHEVDIKWLDSIYENDTLRDSEKTREARVRFLKFSFKVCKQEKIVKKLMDDIKNGKHTNEKAEASGGSGDSKSDDV